VQQRHALAARVLDLLLDRQRALVIRLSLVVAPEAQHDRPEHAGARLPDDIVDALAQPQALLLVGQRTVSCSG
jgi:hypothetical protein